MIELIFVMEASFYLSYTVYKEIRVTSQIRVLPSGTLSKMLDLEIFIRAAGRAECRQKINKDNNGMFIAPSPYRLNLAASKAKQTKAA